MVKKITEEMMIKDLQRYYKEFKEIPRKSTFTGICNSCTIYRHFGTWNKALETADIPILAKTPEKPRLVLCKQCNKEFYKRVSEISKKNNMNFCTKSCFAIYNNKHRKTGTRRAKLEIWLEGQLNKMYPDIKFDYNKVDDKIGYELDIFIKNLKLGIELNGIYHYEPIFGVEKFNQKQRIDKEKIKLCNENSIKLIIIDTRSQKHFSPKTSQKFLDIITSEIDSILFLRSFKIKN
jgi:hypothetical protein